MTYISFLGYIAAFFTTFGLVPQVVRTIKTRETHDLSFWMYAMSSLGAFLWVIYGVILNAWPIIIANATACLLLFIVLLMKIKYG
ncbi:MAG: SemiSWEET transporter [Magnetococcales bacterium]|nr:SemiSWEET transporter [Magnetococcales bacterium]